MPFADRRAAGRALGDAVLGLAGDDPVVLGLPRGGVPVASEVACLLDAPLDVILVRKLGVPVQPELAMGAIGEDGVLIVNDEVILAAGVSAAVFRDIEAAERAELQARSERYRHGHARIGLDGRQVVIVDDGIATGSTARAAIAVARVHGAQSVVLAVPVAPPSTVRALEREADAVVCLRQPDRFIAVGQFYRDFSQTTDAEVIAALGGARGGPPLH